MSRDSERVRASLRLLDRHWQVMTAAVVAIAAVGFLTGIRSDSPAEHPPASEVDRRSTLDVAPRYAEARERRRGPNAGLYEGAFRALGLPRVGAELPAPTLEQRASARTKRERSRAFEGAPPTIPHAIEQRRAPDCLVCHEKGARIAGRIAPAMSHERYDSCTQCHVVSADPRPAFDEAAAFVQPANTFVALGSAPAERVWPGAPPPIPHPTAMRSECLSCHGPGGSEGLRTPHALRQSCTQCHVPQTRWERRFPLAEPSEAAP